MKRDFMIVMICLLGISTLNAKAKPFTKGTIYMNFSLANMTSSQIKNGAANTILTGNNYYLPSYDASWWGSEESPAFSRIARVFTLEYGLSSSLGLEFQLQSRSGDVTLYHRHSYKDPMAYGSPHSLMWNIGGYFNQWDFSVGANYHMDFIKIKGLDVFTGLQIGVEEMSIAFLDRATDITQEDIPEFPDEFFASLKNAPIRSFVRNHTLIYSHIAVGARYFILDRIALQVRSGVKVAFAGWPMTFFYGAGLTVKL